MILKTSMTIDAYLQNAGLKSAGTTRRKQFIPLKTEPNPSFSADLASVRSSIPPESLEKKTGLTIADYLNQASTATSRGFFRNSTLRDGSIHPGRLNRFNHSPVPSNQVPPPPLQRPKALQ